MDQAPETQAPPAEAAPPPAPPAEAPPPPAVEAAPPPAAVAAAPEAPSEPEYQPDEMAANVYNELARVQAQNATMMAEFQRMQEAAAKQELERQDQDLIGRRAQLRERMEAAVEGGDEKARMRLSWEMEDVASQLARREQARLLERFQAPQAQQVRQADPGVQARAVWDAFKGANRISEEEHGRMWNQLQQRAAKGEKVVEGPMLYSQLLRDVRRPAKAAMAPAGKPAPMVEGTGAVGVAKNAAGGDFKYSEADRKRVAEQWFGGLIKADQIGKGDA